MELSPSSLIQEPGTKAAVAQGTNGGTSAVSRPLWLQTAGLWVCPHACHGCLLCGCRFSPIPQEIGLLPPEIASMSVYTSVSEIFFFF